MSDFFNNFIGKNKNFIDKNKKVFLLLISILVVITVFLNSTYSLLFKEDVTDLQSYTTGVLQLTSNTINNSVTLTNSLPMNDEAGLKSTPYDFKITNTGNLTFKFDVKLLSTDTSNQINPQYIKVSVNGEDAVTLNSLTEGKIMENITLDSGRNTKVSLRVWLSEDTPNSEIGKVFNAKIVTEGYAVYTATSVLPDIDYVIPDISDFEYEIGGNLSDNYSWLDVDDNEVLLTSYNGTDENIRIPNTYTIDGTTYKTLLLVDSDTAPAGEMGVFVNNTVIENVYIEDDVWTSYDSGGGRGTSIFALFYGCSNLQSVTFTNPNYYWADNTFGGATRNWTVKVYVPSFSTIYNDLLYWDSLYQLFCESSGEIIPFGETPYTDFTYHTAADLLNGFEIMFHDNESYMQDLEAWTGVVMSIADNEVLLSRYNGTNDNVVIPNTYTIDGIEYNVVVFSGLNVLEEVYGDGVFTNNDNIKNVRIGDSVRFVYIDGGNDDATEGASLINNSVDGLFVNCSSLKTVSIFSSDLVSMNKTFYNCFNLTGKIDIYSLYVTEANYVFYGTSKSINAVVAYESITYSTLFSLLSTNGLPNNVTLTADI